MSAHSWDCAAETGHPCDCGLDALFEAHDPTTCITTWLASGDAVEKLALVLLPDRDHHENCRTRKGGGPCDCWYKRAWPDCLSRAKAILSALTESVKR